ncbi:unnamed protein product [Cyprideis torosa]|uniref:Receptor expression-enhancing protein n=1 Tax=Cyprideis torosa TaxID=163714 RepID=A0A7R8WSA1_9CRUS|nr:unnamed protein product [Cyprideis torosa]CAG0904617.1 unnamed protein product [Cyprideis torosa]
MDTEGNCKFCPGKCSWNIHKNVPFVYAIEKISVTKTHEELRQKWAKAQGDKFDVEEMLERIGQKFGQQQEEVLNTIERINAAIEELEDIAHNPRFMTDVQYIQNLIEAEKSELKPGYAERIAHLSYQRDLAVTMEQAKDPNFDPFEQYRDGKWSKFIEDFNNKYYQQKTTRVRQQAIRHFNLMLHQQNLITDILDAAERMSGIQRRFIAVALIVAVLTLHLSYGYGAELMCNFIGFLYPAYRSITYNTYRCSKEERIQLFIYWLIFAAFDVLEFFADLLLNVLPFYWLFKCAFLVWCFAPYPANGSRFLYHQVIHPYFAERFMRA